METHWIERIQNQPVLPSPHNLCLVRYETCRQSRSTKIKMQQRIIVHTIIPQKVAEKRQSLFNRRSVFSYSISQDMKHPWIYYGSKPEFFHLPPYSPDHAPSVYHHLWRFLDGKQFVVCDGIKHYINNFTAIRVNVLRPDELMASQIDVLNHLSVSECYGNLLEDQPFLYFFKLHRVII